MHAIGASYTTVLRPPDDNYAEFYFEDEAINELGYSYEHAVSSFILPGIKLTFQR